MYLVNCNFCKGSGRMMNPNTFKNELIDCVVCEGKGVVPTREGEKLIEFFNKILKPELMPEVKKEKKDAGK